MATTTVSAELSRDDHKWLLTFQGESGLNRSEIIRAALTYYRASTGPEVVLLQRRLRRFESRVDVRLEALEAKR